MIAKCHFCGKTEDVIDGTQAGDYLACVHCETIGVYDGADASLEMSPSDVADFLRDYPVVSLN